MSACVAHPNSRLTRNVASIVIDFGISFLTSNDVSSVVL